MYNQAGAIADIINAAHDIVILQADNPDGDSLASALALEQILGDLGKEPHVYCGVDVPSYLRYLPGWDRVSRELPPKFDAAIIVDTSAKNLFEQAERNGSWQAVMKRPVIVIDHHQEVDVTIGASVVCNQPAVATGEVLYELAQQLDWPLHESARNAIAVSILSDSLGLMTNKTTARSIHIIAELVEAGVNLPHLDNLRRELGRKSPELVAYKGRLLQRIAYHYDNRIATVDIPWAEIERYSPLYNPSILAIDEMRSTTDTAVAIAFKIYNDGKITGKVRCNHGSPVAADLAAHFGGGGHPYASGFKIKDGRSIADVKADCIAKTIELLNNLAEEPHETL